MFVGGIFAWIACKSAKKKYVCALTLGVYCRLRLSKKNAVASGEGLLGQRWICCNSWLVGSFLWIVQNGRDSQQRSQRPGKWPQRGDIPVKKNVSGRMIACTRPDIDWRDGSRNSDAYICNKFFGPLRLKALTHSVILAVPVVRCYFFLKFRYKWSKRRP